MVLCYKIVHILEIRTKIWWFIYEKNKNKNKFTLNQNGKLYIIITCLFWETQVTTRHRHHIFSFLTTSKSVLIFLIINHRTRYYLRIYNIHILYIFICIDQSHVYDMCIPIQWCHAIKLKKNIMWNAGSSILLYTYVYMLFIIYMLPYDFILSSL